MSMGWPRRLRLAAVWIGFALLLAGTFWGDDDHFPFGPFRMYSVANDLDGEVSTVTFVATMETGRRVEVRPDAFGLRPAEVEGQLARLLDDPSALGRLLSSYEHLNPDAARISQLDLVEETSVLEDGRPISNKSRVLASWEAR